MSLVVRPAPSRRARPLAALAVAVLAAACASAPAKRSAPRRDPLLQPDPVVEHAAAPDTFVVRFETTEGPIGIQFIRAWAPRGADRVYYLVQSGFYDSTRFFRVLPKFVAQWGAHGNPAVNRVWESRTIPDDPVRLSNGRGTVTFATAGANTRTTQLFVNLANNARLDRLGFAPVGRVIEGMAHVDSLYAGYGEGPPKGKGPNQDVLAERGNIYLQRDFPRLDYIVKAYVASESARPAAPKRR